MRTLTLTERQRRLVGFVVSGGLGACIDLGTLALLHELFGVPESIAFLPSTITSCIFVFIFNKWITFQAHTESTLNQAKRFALVYSIAIVLNVLLSELFFRMFRFIFTATFPLVTPSSIIATGITLLLPKSYLLGKALAIGIGAVINYVLSVMFVFKKKPEGVIVV